MISYEMQLDTTPVIYRCPQYDPQGKFEGIRAICYEGVSVNGTQVKVFAYIAYPKTNLPTAPAVVLVHGGGCHPDCAWIHEWTSRGYIVIAPDTTGYFPTQHHTHFCEADRGVWEHKLPDDLSSATDMVASDNSGMLDVTFPQEQRWIYQAVGNVILAHNILRADAMVNCAKIGIAGISWGGVITSLTIGFDDRFAFAIPIYGSAYLSKGLSEICCNFQLAGNEDWYAERYYEKLAIPVMWLCWNDDSCFSVNSNMESHQATKNKNPNTVLSIRHQMYHSHTHALQCPESYWFAEQIVNGRQISRPECKKQGGQIVFDKPQECVRVRLFYIAETPCYVEREKYGIYGHFMKQDWRIVEIPAEVNKFPVPKDMLFGYTEFTLSNGIVLCCWQL